MRRWLKAGDRFWIFEWWERLGMKGEVFLCCFFCFFLFFTNSFRFWVACSAF
jgi:hypothetical protein